MSAFEWAPELDLKHTHNCRVYPTRHAMMRALIGPRQCGAEIGVQAGNFSKFIVDELQPKMLRLVDTDLGQIQHSLSTPGGFVVRHPGRSQEVLAEWGDECLDWIYIDADHDYAPVAADLTQARRVVKNDGLIFCNDYTQYDPIGMKPYGVQKAVNEMCLKYDWELVGFGLHGAGFHDVALRKIR